MNGTEDYELLSKTISSIHQAMGSAHWSIYFDEHGKETHTVLSDEMRLLLGYSDVSEVPDDVEAFLSLIHPDDREKVFRATAAAAKGRVDSERMNIRYRLQTKGDGYRWFRASAAGDYRENGTASVIHGVIQDVTELESLHRDLQRALEATDAIHGSLGSGDWRMTFSRDGAMASCTWSDRFRAMLGYADASDLPDRLESWSDLLHPEDRERVLGEYWGVVGDRTGKRVYDVTYRLLCKDGRYRHYRAVGSVARSGDGSPKTFYGMLIDVTAEQTHLAELEALNAELEERQAQLEEAAAEQESQLEELAALNSELQAHQEQVASMNVLLEERLDIIRSSLNAFFAAYHVDLETDSYSEIKSIANIQDRYDSMGNAQASLFGLCENLIQPEFRDAMREFVDLSTIGERLEGRKSISLRYVGVSTGWSEARFIPATWNPDGTLRSLIWCARTVHEEVEREQEHERSLLAAKEEAEAANHAKTSFLFSMSHDIRTPMNAIIGFAELMERYDDDAERRHDYLRKIKDSSATLLSIINNVLDMARIEKGVVEVSETAWSTEQLNDTLYSVFFELMRTKDIEFERRLDVQHQYVFCDTTKMGQIFNNILSNAFKYTEAGGKVRMLLEEVPSDREGYACFRTTISDTGIGMSPEFLPTIFDEFTREQTTTEAKIEGTGLGMPIVKRMVDLLGGTIEVESQLGVGTTFVVTLHHRIADKSDLAGYQDGNAGRGDFSGKRILLAEDNDLNAEIAMEILGDAGFEVERAENGAACVQMLVLRPAGHYDLVLMDIQMPIMNGYEATRAIRALEDDKRSAIPVVAMTANAFAEDKIEAKLSGMDGHVAKPINITELLRTLAGVLG